MGEEINSEVLKKTAIIFADELKRKFSQIKGISISGSVAEGVADKYSDIDLDIWLSDSDYESWVKECPLVEEYGEYELRKETPSNYTLLRDNFKFDFTLFSIEKTKEAIWRIEQLARRQNSIIIHDPENHVSAILHTKTLLIKSKNFEQKECDKKFSNEFYTFFIGAYINYFTPIEIKRGNFEQAHIDLDFAINLLLEYSFILKDSFFPEVKSKWTYAVKLFNKSVLDKLRDAKLVLAYNISDIERRRKILNEILVDLSIPSVSFSNHHLDE